jgi:hypothetical protein
VGWYDYAMKYCVKLCYELKLGFFPLNRHLFFTHVSTFTANLLGPSKASESSKASCFLCIIFFDLFQLRHEKWRTWLWLGRPPCSPNKCRCPNNSSQKLSAPSLSLPLNYPPPHAHPWDWSPWIPTRRESWCRLSSVTMCPSRWVVVE